MLVYWANPLETEGEMTAAGDGDGEGWSLGQVARLAGLVDYLPGSVACRVLVDRPNGVVSVLAFDCCNDLHRRTPPSATLLYGVEGEARITIGHQSMSLGVGEAMRVRAGEPYSLQALAPFKMLTVSIRT